jgi:hypothetical protein
MRHGGQVVCAWHALCYTFIIYKLNFEGQGEERVGSDFSAAAFAWRFIELPALFGGSHAGCPFRDA